jgi:hypothetical protein
MNPQIPKDKNEPLAAEPSLNRLQLLNLTAGVVAFLMLLLAISISPNTLCYDEWYHIEQAKRVQNSGWRSALTAPDNRSAVGPLYSALHLAASPLTGLHAPAIRYVNLFCLAIVIIALAASAQSSVFLTRCQAGFFILAVPFVWPTVGMALTELPALAAFALFVLAMQQILKPSTCKVSMLGFSWAMIAGLLLGVSILGRQTYLVVLPIVAALVCIEPKKWPHWLVCTAVAGFTCGWLFLLWHGLVPSSMTEANRGLRPDHGVLSLSYVAGASLFLRPDWLKPRSWMVFIVTTVVGIGLTLITRDYGSPPAKSVLLYLFGERFGLLVGFGIGAMLVILGLLWAWNAVCLAWCERHDPLRIFLFLALFALVLAPMKISHLFSSRYVVGLLGILVLVMRLPGSSWKWSWVRILAGALVGAASLWSYYKQ